MSATIDNATRADALEELRQRLVEIVTDMNELLQGTGPVRDHARPWLAHLDRATGCERTRTIEDTIAELRGES